MGDSRRGGWYSLGMPLRLSVLLLPLVVSILSACTASATDPGDAGRDAPLRDAGPPDPMFGLPDRWARVALPAAHDGTTPLPLVVMLHGYGVTTLFENAYLGPLDTLTRARGIYLLLPQATENSASSPFWNATDGCCNFDGSSVDDVAFLDRTIDEVIAALPIDTSRIYLIGHSNGGFMSYRLACERGSRFAGVAVFAGADYLDPMACVPTTPVSILHLHGDADETVAYAGGAVENLMGLALPPHPGARVSVERWAGYAGCDPTPVAGMARDLTIERTGHTEVLETEVLDFTACDPGLDVTLWTMRGEGHGPPFHPDGFDQVLDWLLEHTR